jgi:3-oxoadipate enol-lactonase
MPHIERQRQRISYAETGSGPAVVLGHSLLCSGEMWENQVPVLGASYRVVNIDYRGHGKSSTVRSRFTLSDLVDDTVAILDELGIEQAIWAGLSTGGMVALRAAVDVPERVRAILVADASAASEPLYPRVKYRALGLGARIVGLRPFVPAVLPIMFGKTTLRENRVLVDEWIPNLLSIDLPSVLRVLEAVVTRESLLGDLPGIDVPSLVMVGNEDVAQPVPRSQQIAEGIPGSLLEIIPKAGHLCALEQPERVTEVMLEFFDSLPNP